MSHTLEIFCHFNGNTHCKYYYHSEPLSSFFKMITNVTYQLLVDQFEWYQANIYCIFCVYKLQKLHLHKRNSELFRILICRWISRCYIASWPAKPSPSTTNFKFSDFTQDQVVSSTMPSFVCRKPLQNIEVTVIRCRTGENRPPMTKDSQTSKQGGHSF